MCNEPNILASSGLQAFIILHNTVSISGLVHGDRSLYFNYRIGLDEVHYIKQQLLYFIRDIFLD